MCPTIWPSDPSLLSAKILFANLVARIRSSCRRKKKETFDFKSLTTRPPLTDVYPKNFQPKEKTIKNNRNLSVLNSKVWTYTIFWLFEYIIYESIEWLSTHQILPEKECHVQKFPPLIHLWRDWSRVPYCKYSQKYRFTKLCIQLPKNMCIKEEKRRKLTLKYMDYHIEKASKIFLKIENYKLASHESVSSPSRWPVPRNGSAWWLDFDIFPRMTLNSRRRRGGPRKKALEEGRVTVAIVVSGRKEEGEGARRKEREGEARRWSEREREERRPTRDKTRRADDGYDGDGQWLYTG